MAPAAHGWLWGNREGGPVRSEERKQDSNVYCPGRNAEDGCSRSAVLGFGVGGVSVKSPTGGGAAGVPWDPMDS